MQTKYDSFEITDDDIKKEFEKNKNSYTVADYNVITITPKYDATSTEQQKQDAKNDALNKGDTFMSSVQSGTSFIDAYKIIYPDLEEKDYEKFEKGCAVTDAKYSEDPDEVISWIFSDGRVDGDVTKFVDSQGRVKIVQVIKSPHENDFPILNARYIYIDLSLGEYTESTAKKLAEDIINQVSKSENKDEEFDWEAIFAGADWFHWTGITPALSENMAKACMDACKKAKEKGITVSCDLNYRKKLWTREKAGEVMAQLMPYVDVCIANEEDCADVFGIHAEHTDIEGGKLDYAAYESVARQLSRRFGCKKVAITLRGSISASENTWAGMLYDRATDTADISRSYLIKIVDRVGGGDSFGGGLIYALSQGYSNADAINFAVAASCLKHTIEHDFNEVKVEEVLALMKGSGSGRVQR